MEFFVNFGKDKNKENHISNFNGKKKIEFNIVISQKNRTTNEKEYAYLKAESWDWNVIEALEEGKKFTMGDFYFKFWKDKNNFTYWIMVVKSLKNIENNNNQNFDMEELEEAFEDNNKEQENWELDI